MQTTGHGRRRMLWSLVATVVIMVAMAAWRVQAEPIIPRARELPEEIQSLARIDQVQLKVLKLPRSLRERGFTESEVRRRCIAWLAMDGIEVRDDPYLPRMELWFKDVRNQKRPSISCVTTVVSIFQSVRVKRLERDMNVPTACFVGATLTTAAELVDDVMRDLRSRCHNISQSIKSANASR